MMTIPKALAIAASAYNVCGPRTGEAATPSTITNWGRTDVLRCMGLYMDAHDGELFTRAEIVEASELLANA